VSLLKKRNLYFIGALIENLKRGEVLEMRKIEDIIFLGAGASASEGAPLKDALFRDYFLLSGEDPQEVHQEMNQMLSSFFSAFFGIDVQDADLREISFPTFEECLGILELALNRQESFKNFSQTPERPDIQRLRQHLIFLIAIILNNKLRDSAGYHIRLVKRLLHENKLRKTAFITSNYDILIDNALLDLFEEGIDLDYGVDFTNFIREQNWTRPRPRESVKLFKIHGSLNWLYCPTCLSLTLTPKEKRVATLVFRPQPCPICRSHMIPIIIPPTFFKVMSNYYLQEIWKKAEEHIKQARRIFFCGYSFPDADIHVKYLLKRAELNRRSPLEIFVINNHEGKTEHEKQGEKRRFERFFKDKQRVHYTELSFQEFCQHGVDTNCSIV